MLEPQTDGNSVDQPASAESSYKPIFKAKPKHQILVLGSSHGRGIGQRLQNAMGDGYAVTSIFKPNVDLRSVTGDRKFVYPMCLYFLDLLQYEHFRREVVSAQCTKFIDDQQILLWQHYTRRRTRLLQSQAEQVQNQTAANTNGQSQPQKT
ncbi:hypothetical protein B7P43_G09670 [Cryptotermes secundus]|uniref:Mediator of RNA polymerase II transcription subunit 31 n=1 Tax=Cryptotermes secundus TaxID=105785 RepID=A0A2J7Q782_9NEOP|nr:hypothetical protein B7P43_G09670 [Cryptotermes secundus]